MCPAGRCRLLSKASLLQTDKQGLMSWSPGLKIHFYSGVLLASTRPHGNLLAHAGPTVKTHLDLIIRLFSVKSGLLYLKLGTSSMS